MNHLNHYTYHDIFACRLQVVITNRLVLNLSHAANGREDSEFTTRTNLDPPKFASGPFLGNIGGPVRSLPDEFYDEELEDDVPANSDGVHVDRIGLLDIDDSMEFNVFPTTSERDIEKNVA